MSIKVKCFCGKALAVPDNLAGKKGRCPECKNVLDIPEAPTKPAPPPKEGPKFQATEETLGLAPEVEVTEKVKPLMFNSSKSRDRCRKCGLYNSDGDGLCDKCAGGVAKVAAKVAARNMKGKDVDPSKQPGYSQIRSLISIFLVPLYIIFFPFLVVIGLLMGGATVVADSDSRTRGDDVEDD